MDDRSSKGRSPISSKNLPPALLSKTIFYSLFKKRISSNQLARKFSSTTTRSPPTPPLTPLGFHLPQGLKNPPTRIGDFSDPT